ncbi:MAG: hypothetical protein L0220_27325 [Acidobacteria bacterium]|nr:hypothetical protein [Acidobacteriota bacterium]
MTQHISESELNSFSSGLLPASKTIPFAEHLEICRECSRRLATLRKRKPRRHSPSTFLAGTHIEYESICDYLEDRLDVNDRILIDIHLQLCHICHDDVKSLKEFRESSGGRPEIKFSIRGYLAEIFVSIGRMSFLDTLPAKSAILILISLVLFIALLIARDFRNQSLSSSGPVQNRGVETETPPHKQPGQTSVSQNNAVTPVVVNQLKLSEVIYDKGRKYGLDDRGNNQGLDYLPREIRGEVANALRGKRINRKLVLDELDDTVTELRGNTVGKGDIWLTGPVETLIIQDRPLLKWRRIKDATSYLADIVDESFNPIAQSGLLTSPEWLVDITLKRDTVYLWQVSAYRDNERIESDQNRIGKFKVISAEKLERVEIARKNYPSHLALAVFYIKEGLLDDARSELQKLISRNPQSKLLKRIYRREIASRRSFPDVENE